MRTQDESEASLMQAVLAMPPGESAARAQALAALREKAYLQNAAVLNRILPAAARIQPVSAVR